MTFCCVEGGLPFVTLTNTDIVISGSDVKFGEQRMSLEFFGDVLDVWNRVLISDRPVVDRPIVLYRAIGSVLLFDTEGACGVCVTTFPLYPLTRLSQTVLSKPPFVLPVSSATSPSFPLSQFSSSSLADVVPLHPYLGL